MKKDIARSDKANRKKFDPKGFAKKYLKDGHPWDGHKTGTASKEYQENYDKISWG